MTNTLIPIYREDVSMFFVDPGILEPVQLDENHLTSAVKFGKVFDLLAISTSRHLLDQGLADQTYSISPDGARLTSVVYRIGTVTHVQLIESTHVCATFTAKAAGNFREVSLNCDYTVPVRPKHPSFHIFLSGGINTELGQTVVHAQSNNPNVELLGYTLEAVRTNLNRPVR